MKYASSLLEVYLSMLSMLQLSNGINRDLNIYIYIYIYILFLYVVTLKIKVVNANCFQQSDFPVDMRRRVNVYKTSIRLQHRIDVL